MPEDGVTTESLGLLLEEHFERYCDLEAADVYKLIHQRVCGPGHLLASPLAAHRALITEASALDLNEIDEADVVEVLDDERRIARINLRPYLRAGGSIARLWEAVQQTAARLHIDRTRLRAELAAMAHWVKTHEPEQYTSLSRLLGRATRDGHPPLKHSQRYRVEHKPAYRVILLDTLHNDW